MGAAPVAAPAIAVTTERGIFMAVANDEAASEAEGAGGDSFCAPHLLIDTGELDGKVTSIACCSAACGRHLDAELAASTAAARKRDGAALQWLPQLAVTVKDRHDVRFVTLVPPDPEAADGLWRADGITLCVGSAELPQHTVSGVEKLAAIAPRRAYAPRTRALVAHIGHAARRKRQRLSRRLHHPRGLCCACCR
jgi:hypothetical protein